MLERWIADKATVMARNLGYDNDKREVLQYSMTILSTTIMGFLAIGLVGALAGVAGLALTAGLSEEYCDPIRVVPMPLRLFDVI
ncbi:MAG: hypothetical protein ACYDG6_01405 [Thermincolia bacterium]